VKAIMILRRNQRLHLWILHCLLITKYFIVYVHQMRSAHTYSRCEFKAAFTAAYIRTTSQPQTTPEASLASLTLLTCESRVVINSNFVALRVSAIVSVDVGRIRAANKRPRDGARVRALQGKVTVVADSWGVGT
jgi:hypothetical protein